uniref:Uncharacterized protein n=1 Tax=Panagrolaimus sp. JU765 TaxID=591449 RepID=A0AC34R3W1_9BILA
MKVKFLAIFLLINVIGVYGWFDFVYGKDTPQTGCDYEIKPQFGLTGWTDWPWRCQYRNRVNVTCRLGKKINPNAYLQVWDGDIIGDDLINTDRWTYISDDDKTAYVDLWVHPQQWEGKDIPGSHIELYFWFVNPCGDGNYRRGNLMENHFSFP